MGRGIAQKFLIRPTQLERRLRVDGGIQTNEKVRQVVQKSLSIVVPTYREAENLPHLLEKIARALQDSDISWNVIVVDDNSPDETRSVCANLSEVYPLRLIVRTEERGLASAVVHGMHTATSDYLLCMDADLSHPADAIPEMIATLSRDDCDFVIGSRYVEGGSTDDDWGLFRWLNSIVATGFAKPLTSAKDPMAGFFALRKSDFEAARDSLDPVGYKIGLELIVKCGCRNVREVPIHFADRQYGESKLSLKEQLNYLRHVGKLYAYRWPELFRFGKFGLVGGSGVFVNLLALSLLLSVSVATPLAMALAIWVAMSSNYLLNRSFTFRDRRAGSLLGGYLQFCLASLGGALLSWTVSTALWFSIPIMNATPTLAALFGIVSGMGLNYFLCRKFVFCRPVSVQQLTAQSDTCEPVERASAA